MGLWRDVSDIFVTFSFLDFDTLLQGGRDWGIGRDVGHVLALILPIFSGGGKFSYSLSFSRDIFFLLWSWWAGSGM